MAADVNGASWQPTSRQNRCSEVADNAGIARKRRAMAHTTAQYVAWVVSTWPAINSITGSTFWKPATGWKPVNWLKGYRFHKPSAEARLEPVTYKLQVWCPTDITHTPHTKLHVFNSICDKTDCNIRTTGCWWDPDALFHPSNHQWTGWGSCTQTKQNVCKQRHIQYNTIQYNIKTCNAPYVTKMLFVGAGMTRD